MALFDATLKCPACGGRNIHFSSVVVRVAPDDDYRVVEYVFPGRLERGAGDLGVVEPGPLTASECRGGGIEVRYDCESCPHRWGVRQDFHKGSIYSATVELPIREDRLAEAKERWEERALRESAWMGEHLQPGDSQPMLPAADDEGEA